MGRRPQALELRCPLLLMDEDSCATNFMARDALMAALVPVAKEPITPLLERVPQLVAEHGLSLVLAVGALGQYCAVHGGWT